MSPESCIKVLKFGGKSLSNQGIYDVLSIIERISVQTRILVVLSARGNATNDLQCILEKACKGEDYVNDLNSFFQEQKVPVPQIDFLNEYKHLDSILKKVEFSKCSTPKIKDEFISMGEILSCKIMTHLLKERNYKVSFTDTRSVLKTDSNFCNAKILDYTSRRNVIKAFANWNDNTIQIATGFISSNLDGETTTLGRNGSNYTATLLADYLDAKEVQNWTNVSGIYTADPKFIPTAEKIKNISFEDANKLAHIGIEILHHKTIIPLIRKQIPIRILNTLAPQDEGTLISNEIIGFNLKTLSVVKNLALITLKSDILSKASEICEKIYFSMRENGVIMRMAPKIYEKREITFVERLDNLQKVKKILHKQYDINPSDKDSLVINKNIGVICFIGNLHGAISDISNVLKEKSIPIHLISNDIDNHYTSVVVEGQNTVQALNAIYEELFDKNHKIKLQLPSLG
ncbi:aspartate kinase [Ichthyobacterium seriolicida]|uniref:Aspartokinase n=1 Tax=Ichthyobacterium seriolicida TaxID=242600 RepID=A0A1J1DYL8_9FLAO|nr:aspartate kinase [Ichthyobacterium seriolicida]BAV95010.1 homoserine dehydrogenase [Ichthyobacterium seriolicida]